MSQTPAHKREAGGLWIYPARSMRESMEDQVEEFEQLLEESTLGSPAARWIRSHPVPQPPSITCPRCERVSHNGNDIREGYCGHCHDWTGLSGC